jgi:hypothetical protein
MSWWCCCAECDYTNCINAGSFRTECDFCNGSGTSGTPQWYTVSWPLNATFSCCEGLVNTTFLMSEDTSEDNCLWTHYSGELNCGVPDTTYTVRLELGGTDPESNTLTITFGSGEVIVYTNNSEWNCSCTNKMTLDEYETTVTDCEAPAYVCVDPLDECCQNQRTEPLPDVLTVTVTTVQNCSCADGQTGTITWDPEIEKWVGSMSFCTDDVDMELSCSTTVPPGTDTWIFTVASSGAGDNCFSGMTRLGQSEFSADIDDYSCDPFLIQWRETSEDGCCQSTTSQLYFTISE